MKDVFNSETAFVGVLFDSKVIYTVVDRDGEFEYTGLSTINFLKNNKIEFIQQVFNSQKFNGVKYIFDDRFVNNELSNEIDIDFEDFNYLRSFIIKEYKNIYIYDVFNDLLIVKNKDLIAIDYKNSEDVRGFKKSL